MVEIKNLAVELRAETGKRRNRRLRAKGLIPAVLYGHKKDNLKLSISADEVLSVLRHGSRFVVLTGAVSERAFIKECQWDTWGLAVLHVDFTRISEHERVQLSVPLELRGDAPGVKDGGVVNQVFHEVQIECEPAFAPERIVVRLNTLGFKEMIHLSGVEMPEGVKLLSDPNQVVVECVEPTKEEEEVVAPVVEEGNEPEVIGRKKTEEEEDAEKNEKK